MIGLLKIGVGHYCLTPIFTARISAVYLSVVVYFLVCCHCVWPFILTFEYPCRYAWFFILTFEYPCHCACLSNSPSPSTLFHCGMLKYRTHSPSTALPSPFQCRIIQKPPELCGASYKRFYAVWDVVVGRLESGGMSTK